MDKADKKIRIFLDDDSIPFAEYTPPVKFQLDTTKMQDGDHTLTIVARSTDGREGIKKVDFVVRNGPEINVSGIKNNDVVDDKVNIVVNAYGSETREIFVVDGSENPNAIPNWLWVVMLGFIAWGAFYLISYLNAPN
ncbi:cytochrome C [Fulvivirgaceae bacterium BMA12]|uniref:Cytochrome C n=1 Tax=Agaribacillus aureus TaxID=3051825 RepID=A0ABT8LH54_9BACT|nr:cytochrome C [Fulvivirgaceae bacterium BMA12]